ncbi:hypothetical protein NLU13_4901 [Sarocladium strictum]|uniref:Major facilitator superfamily (MFS) profile domain-containing protein n=1 Tax=Sarocladium strictum TaxID=5046 RepID=A0AA39GJS2_SARSR|nr:hypothetical protein NLU13_4901 [Sarocladium strictum]
MTSANNEAHQQRCSLDEQSTTRFDTDTAVHRHPAKHHSRSSSLSSGKRAPSSSSSSSSKHQSHHPASPSAALSSTAPEARDDIVTERGQLNDEEKGEKPGKDDGGGRQDEGQQVDENLVTWDGPDDPANPKNWTIKKKWAAVVTVSLFTLISPVSSTMAAPALPAIGHSLHIDSQLELALTLSIFVAAYAVGPLLWGPLSELQGRVVILQVSNLWFFCFNLGCALARNKASMIALRFLAGLGGSAPQAVGGGVLADLFVPEQRGKAIAMYAVAPLLGPAVGPIAGGWIAERTTWRWVFYSTTILCGFVQLAAWFFLEETYAPVLLARKKALLVRETGNADLHTEDDRPDRTYSQTLRLAFTRPFRLLFTQPIIIFVAAYMTYLYGTMYLILTTFPTIFANIYHQSPGIQGLNYISLGTGFYIGAQVCAPLQDRVYKALKKRRVPEGQPGVPEFRVPLMAPGALLVPMGLLIYGWTAEYHTHWIGPNIGAALFAAGMNISYQCFQTYLVDTFARFAASAVAATTVTRSLAGFAFPLFAGSMYDRLGYGWGATLLAGVAIVLGIPAPIWLWFYGAKMRARSAVAR